MFPMEVAKLDFHNNNKKASKLAGTFTISDRTIEKSEEDVQKIGLMGLKNNILKIPSFKWQMIYFTLRDITIN